MQKISRNQKAQNIRSVIRYINKFKNAVLVIYLDDEVINSPLFSSHIRDIAIIHQAGIKVVLVPGSKKRIDQVLTDFNLSWNYKNNIRITSENSMPLIKMAAFDISNIIMTSLAEHHISATIGNWVKARAIGVIDGTDFSTAGEIEKLNTNAINSILDDGFIPIFPCIGWSSVGKPYNISSVSLAEQIAISLNADKLFFVMMNAEINSQNFNIPQNIGLSDESEIPAMNLEELDTFLEQNSNSENKKILSILKIASNACKNGVSRTHIINGSLDGAMPCEIFSDLGSGTMIYSTNYGKIRFMNQQDIPAVLSVMQPFIEKEILLPRNYENLLENLSDYIVYEIDGGIRACGALHDYGDGQAEILGIAVDSSFSNLGIGPKIIEFLIQQAKSKKIKTIFILTTKTSDWFESLGFTSDTIDSIPLKRKKLWNPKRNSKVFRLSLN